MSDGCGDIERGEDRWKNLRIGAIFIVLITSLCGTLAPILAKRTWRVPAPAFDFVKFFGSGVIIATAFIHLLAPAYDALTSECLSDVWHSYPFAPAFAMISVFGLFLVELFAFRTGDKMIRRTGLAYDVHAGPKTHTHHEGANTSHPIHGIETVPAAKLEGGSSDHNEHPEGDLMLLPDDEGYETDPRLIVAQIIGVAVLEFGIILHSIIIGLTLAVDDSFRTLFVVIIFHQMFEGLGLGSRLAFLKLAPHLSWVPYAASMLYSAMTPIGMAIGLGIRTTYNPNSTTASLVQGTLDALSAGVLLYTGLVELLAHEFLFNPRTRDASTLKILYACTCMITGAGIMALLGRWA